MGDKLTLDKVKKAEEFDSSLCAPVSYILNTFADELPAEDVLFMSLDMISDTHYIPPDSDLLQYYYDRLTYFKKTLSSKNTADFFRVYYDPAIKFFEDSIKKRSAVIIRCDQSDPVSIASPPLQYPITKPVDQDQVENLLKNQFGFEIKGDFEAWSGQRVFYSDIKKGNDLIILLADHHGKRAISEDEMKFYDRLYENRDRIDVHVAFELSENDVDLIYEQTPLITKKLNKAKSSEEDIKTPKNMFDLAIDTYFIEKSCVRGNLSGTQISKKCLQDTMTTVKDAIIVYFTGNERKDYWALADSNSSEKYRELFIKSRRKGISEEEQLSFSQELYGFTIRKSEDLAKGFLNKIKKTKNTNNPRIFIVSVGGLHILDMIRHMQDKTNASIIGLMPIHLTESLPFVAKSKKK